MTIQLTPAGEWWVSQGGYLDEDLYFDHHVSSTPRGSYKAIRMADDLAMEALVCELGGATRPFLDNIYVRTYLLEEPMDFARQTITQALGRIPALQAAMLAGMPLFSIKSWPPGTPGGGVHVRGRLRVQGGSFLPTPFLEQVLREQP